MTQAYHHDAKYAYKRIKDYRQYLTRQQTKTLAGQIKSGNVNGAMSGLDKILTRAGVARYE